MHQPGSDQSDIFYQQDCISTRIRELLCDLPREGLRASQFLELYADKYDEKLDASVFGEKKPSHVLYHFEDDVDIVEEECDKWLFPICSDFDDSDVSDDALDDLEDKVTKLLLEQPDYSCPLGSFFDLFKNKFSALKPSDYNVKKPSHILTLIPDVIEFKEKNGDKWVTLIKIPYVSESEQSESSDSSVHSEDEGPSDESIIAEKCVVLARRVLRVLGDLGEEGCHLARFFQLYTKKFNAFPQPSDFKVKKPAQILELIPDVCSIIDRNGDKWLVRKQDSWVRVGQNKVNSDGKGGAQTTSSASYTKLKQGTATFEFVKSNKGIKTKVYTYEMFVIKDRVRKILVDAPSAGLSASQILATYKERYGEKVDSSVFGVAKPSYVFSHMPDICKVQEVTSDKWVIPIRAGVMLNKTSTDNGNSEVISQDVLSIRVKEILALEPHQSCSLKSFDEKYQKRFATALNPASFQRFSLLEVLKLVPHVCDIVPRAGENWVVVIREDKNSDEEMAATLFNVKERVCKILAEAPLTGVSASQILASYKEKYCEKLDPSVFGVTKPSYVFAQMPDICEVQNATSDKLVIPIMDGIALNTIPVFIIKNRVSKILAEAPLAGLSASQILSIYKEKYGEKLDPSVFGVAKPSMVFSLMPDICKVQDATSDKWVTPFMIGMRLNTTPGNNGNSVIMSKDVLSIRVKEILALEPRQCCPLKDFQNKYQKRFGLSLNPVIFQMSSLKDVLKLVPQVCEIVSRAGEEWVIVTQEIMLSDEETETTSTAAEVEALSSEAGLPQQGALQFIEVDTCPVEDVPELEQIDINTLRKRCRDLLSKVPSKGCSLKTFLDAYLDVYRCWFRPQHFGLSHVSEVFQLLPDLCQISQSQGQMWITPAEGLVSLSHSGDETGIPHILQEQKLVSPVLSESIPDVTVGMIGQTRADEDASAVKTVCPPDRSMQPLKEKMMFQLKLLLDSMPNCGVSATDMLSNYQEEFGEPLTAGPFGVSSPKEVFRLLPEICEVDDSFQDQWIIPVRDSDKYSPIVPVIVGIEENHAGTGNGEHLYGAFCNKKEIVNSASTSDAETSTSVSVSCDEDIISDFRKRMAKVLLQVPPEGWLACRVLEAYKGTYGEKVDARQLGVDKPSKAIYLLTEMCSVQVKANGERWVVPFHRKVKKFLYENHLTCNSNLAGEQSENAAKHTADLQRCVRRSEKLAQLKERVCHILTSLPADGCLLAAFFVTYYKKYGSDLSPADYDVAKPSEILGLIPDACAIYHKGTVPWLRFPKSHQKMSQKPATQPPAKVNDTAGADPRDVFRFRRQMAQVLLQVPEQGCAIYTVLTMYKDTFGKNLDPTPLLVKKPSKAIKLHLTDLLTVQMRGTEMWIIPLHRAIKKFLTKHEPPNEAQGIPPRNQLGVQPTKEQEINQTSVPSWKLARLRKRVEHILESEPSGGCLLSKFFVAYKLEYGSLLDPKEYQVFKPSNALELIPDVCVIYHKGSVPWLKFSAWFHNVKPAVDRSRDLPPNGYTTSLSTEDVSIPDTVSHVQVEKETEFCRDVVYAVDNTSNLTGEISCPVDPFNDVTHALPKTTPSAHEVRPCIHDLPQGGNLLNENEKTAMPEPCCEEFRQIKTSGNSVAHSMMAMDVGLSASGNTSVKETLEAHTHKEADLIMVKERVQRILTNHLPNGCSLSTLSTDYINTYKEKMSSTVPGIRNVDILRLIPDVCRVENQGVGQQYMVFPAQHQCPDKENSSSVTTKTQSDLLRERLLKILGNHPPEGCKVTRLASDYANMYGESIKVTFSCTYLIAVLLKVPDICMVEMKGGEYWIRLYQDDNLTCEQPDQEAQDTILEERSSISWTHFQCQDFRNNDSEKVSNGNSNASEDHLLRTQCQSEDSGNTHYGTVKNNSNNSECTDALLRERLLIIMGNHLQEGCKVGKMAQEYAHMYGESMKITFSCNNVIDLLHEVPDLCKVEMKAGEHWVRLCMQGKPIPKQPGHVNQDPVVEARIRFIARASDILGALKSDGCPLDEFFSTYTRKYNHIPVSELGFDSHMDCIPLLSEVCAMEICDGSHILRPLVNHFVNDETMAVCSQNSACGGSEHVEAIGREILNDESTETLNADEQIQKNFTDMDGVTKERNKSAQILRTDATTDCSLDAARLQDASDMKDLEVDPALVEDTKQEPSTAATPDLKWITMGRDAEASGCEKTESSVKLPVIDTEVPNPTCTANDISSPQMEVTEHGICGGDIKTFTGEEIRDRSLLSCGKIEIADSVDALSKGSLHKDVTLQEEAPEVAVKFHEKLPHSYAASSDTSSFEATEDWQTPVSGPASFCSEVDCTSDPFLDSSSADDDSTDIFAPPMLGECDMQGLSCDVKGVVQDDIKKLVDGSRSVRKESPTKYRHTTELGLRVVSILKTYPSDGCEFSEFLYRHEMQFGRQSLPGCFNEAIDALSCIPDVCQVQSIDGNMWVKFADLEKGHYRNTDYRHRPKTTQTSAVTHHLEKLNMLMQRTNEILHSFASRECHISEFYEEYLSKHKEGLHETFSCKREVDVLYLIPEICQVVMKYNAQYCTRHRMNAWVKMSQNQKDAGLGSSVDRINSNATDVASSEDGKLAFELTTMDQVNARIFLLKRRVSSILDKYPSHQCKVDQLASHYEALYGQTLAEIFKFQEDRHVLHLISDVCKVDLQVTWEERSRVKEEHWVSLVGSTQSVASMLNDLARVEETRRNHPMGNSYDPANPNLASTGASGMHTMENEEEPAEHCAICLRERSRLASMAGVMMMCSDKEGKLPKFYRLQPKHSATSQELFTLLSSQFDLLPVYDIRDLAETMNQHWPAVVQVKESERSGSTVVPDEHSVEEDRRDVEEARHDYHQPLRSVAGDNHGSPLQPSASDQISSEVVEPTGDAAAEIPDSSLPSSFYDAQVPEDCHQVLQELEAVVKNPKQKRCVIS